MNDENNDDNQQTRQIYKKPSEKRSDQWKKEKNTHRERQRSNNVMNIN